MKLDILTIKGWMILLAFFIVLWPMTIILTFINALSNSTMVDTLGTVAFLTVFFLYPLLVGIRLRAILSSQPLYNKKSNTSLIVDCCLIGIAVAAGEILPYQEKTFDIFSAIIAVLGVVGIVRLAAFPAHEIRSIELKRNAGFWEYVSETVQMIYWPLGVLWMQPRVNKIADKKTITISE